MIRIQKAEARGSTRNAWLDSRHSFSFGDWYDEQHVHFGPLRVLNDDVVRAGGGFPTHPHRDMEILTYVIDGALEHRDSSGGHGVIGAGEVQRMTAGRGVTHSEFNHSQDEDVHFLQIWIFPRERGLDPGYEQKEFTPGQRRNVLLPVAGPVQGSDALHIHQDAAVFISRLETGGQIAHPLADGRGGFAFVVTGAARINGSTIGSGDSLSVSQEDRVLIESVEDTELVFFDLPMENWD